MGSWKGRGNQYIQLVKVLHCKRSTYGNQLPAFPLEVESEVYLDLRGVRRECYHHAPQIDLLLQLLDKANLGSCCILTYYFYKL